MKGTDLLLIVETQNMAPFIIVLRLKPAVKMLLSRAREATDEI